MKPGHVAVGASVGLSTRRVASRRVAAGGARQGPTLWRSSLRYDCAAVLFLESHRRTHFAPCGRFVQTSCGESEVEARFASRLKACAPRRHRVGPCRAPPAAHASSGGFRRPPLLEQRWPGLPEPPLPSRGEPGRNQRWVSIQPCQTRHLTKHFQFLPQVLNLEQVFEPKSTFELSGKSLIRLIFYRLSGLTPRTASGKVGSGAD